MRALPSMLCLLAASLAAQPEIHPDELKLKPRIDAAIDNGVEALLQAQIRDGTWGRYGRFDGGKTALCAYALLKCGVGHDHPAVRRSLLYLDGVQPRETYTVACMMLAYAAAGTKSHLARVKSLSKLLVSWQLPEKGDFGYPFPDQDDKFTRPDLSNTQYAALGLWIAQKHKIRIPNKVWQALLDATLPYQAKPERIQRRSTEADKSRTVVGGKVEVRGFGYRPKGKPTGSMTTAGVSVLQICKLGLGGRLGHKSRRRVDDAIEKGVAWLAHHFSVRRNPGARNWHYYYLYGLERVGSLTRTEKFGRHWWYVKGARHLLGAQRGDGLWPGRGPHPELETAFALLFLRRATQLAGAAITGRGGGAGSAKRHLFSAGGPGSDVQIQGAGQQPLALYIPGFGPVLRNAHKKHGLRVVQVEYVAGPHGDYRVLGQLEGKPGKAWTNDTFLYRVQALSRGVHRVRARVTLVAPDVPPGETTPSVTILSPTMKVEIRDVFAKWMEVVAKLGTPDNLLRTVKVSAIGSTNLKRAAEAIDGNDSTHWVCHDSDEKPELTIQLSKKVKVGKIVLTQAGARGKDRGEYGQILNVEVFINKDVKPWMIEMDEDQLAATIFALPKKRKVERLRFRIVASIPGRRGTECGFSEIAVMK